MTLYLGRIQAALAKSGTEWTATDPVLMSGEFGVGDAGSAAPLLKVGDGVRPWSALPALGGAGGGSADYVAGDTVTLPPGSQATVDIDNTVDPPTISFGIPTGNTGPPNVLTIGTVTTAPPGGAAAASITGSSPAQVLNLTIPTGADGVDGDDGAPGPPNELAIGTVTTGLPGTPADATITGTYPDQVLNLTIPAGNDGIGAPGVPSVMVGLVAKPGVLNSYLRSDGAPALDQAIAPVWTGFHMHNAAVGIFTAQLSGALLSIDRAALTPSAAAFRIKDTTAGATDRAYVILTNDLDSDLQLRVSESGAAGKYGFVGPSTATRLAMGRAGAGRFWLDLSQTANVYGNPTDKQLHTFHGGARIQGVYENAVPAIGAPSAMFNILNLSAWGMIAGTLGSGDGYIQAQRVDGTAAVYRLLLNPNGGGVAVGPGVAGGAPSLVVQSNGGAINLRLLRDGTNTLDFYHGGGVQHIDASQPGSSLSLDTGGISRMTIGAAGNVIINAPSAGATLQVAAAVGTYGAAFTNGTGSFGGIALIGGYQYGMRSTNGGQYEIWNDSIAKLRLAIAPGGAVVIPRGETTTAFQVGDGLGEARSLFQVSNAYALGLSFGGGGNVYLGAVSNAADPGLQVSYISGNPMLRMAAGKALFDFDSGGLYELGFRHLVRRVLALPVTISQSDNGRAVEFAGAGTLTLGDLEPWSIVTILTTNGPITVTPAAGSTLYWVNGSGTLNAGNRTMANASVATAWRSSSTTWYIWGMGLS